jgi:hypothetical protein
MTEPEIQMSTFRRACELIGGQREAARVLHMNDRHIRHLIAGTKPLHASLLAEICTALLDHADECRRVERQLSPTFRDNLTERQRERTPHGNIEVWKQRRAAQIDNALDAISSEGGRNNG